MTKLLATTCLAAMFVVGLASQCVRAQDADSLKGLTAVAVLVEELPDGAKALGLTKEAIQTDVELKLRLAGMRVVTTEEDLSLPGVPYVYVQVNVTNSAAAASIEVELFQDALLKRTGQLTSAVATWQRGGVLANPTGQGIRDRVKDVVDLFLNAWLSVNTKN